MKTSQTVAPDGEDAERVERRKWRVDIFHFLARKVKGAHVVQRVHQVFKMRKTRSTPASRDSETPTKTANASCQSGCPRCPGCPTRTNAWTTCLALQNRQVVQGCPGCPRIYARLSMRTLNPWAHVQVRFRIQSEIMDLTRVKMIRPIAPIELARCDGPIGP